MAILRINVLATNTKGARNFGIFQFVFLSSLLQRPSTSFFSFFFLCVCATTSFALQKSSIHSQQKRDLNRNYNRIVIQKYVS